MTDQRTIQILFALLRSAIRGELLTEDEKNTYSPQMLPDLLAISKKQDVAHLLVFALKKNGLLRKEDAFAEKIILMAVYRCERLITALREVSEVLEAAEIPFIPLKGSILRGYYPEEWMRTSCDVDVLVHSEDLARATEQLTSTLGYVEQCRSTHDVALEAPGGIHVELHFDLVEEGKANDAIQVLSKVWNNAHLCNGSLFHYEMSDSFFYFYHIAHMAKHFEVGGCGIRPFMDLYILDHTVQADAASRTELLKKGDLFRFATVCQALSRVWFEGQKADPLSLQMQEFLLHGGIYGSVDNRVALNQKKNGGRFGYLLSRIFVPYDKLRRYYPILEKNRCLVPVMQVRRWFMLFRPEVATMAKNELKTNRRMGKGQADEMGNFLQEIGL
ncbi:MAG: nucleotidyltransferase family protein [Clostridia bacterium]|nr:nucleotidyltransferase family protein [Clostridia bacterium]